MPSLPVGLLAIFIKKTKKQKQKQEPSFGLVGHEADGQLTIGDFFLIAVCPLYAGLGRGLEGE